MKKLNYLVPASWLLVVAVVIVLVVLRIVQVVDWPWTWILAPLWIYPALFFLALGVLLFAGVLIAKTGRKK